jgi:hypothetical protein
LPDQIVSWSWFSSSCRGNDVLNHRRWTTASQRLGSIWNLGYSDQNNAFDSALTYPTPCRCRYFSTSTVAAADADDDHEGQQLLRPSMVRRSGVRNVAVIAHVDHG